MAGSRGDFADIYPHPFRLLLLLSETYKLVIQKLRIEKNWEHKEKGADTGGSCAKRGMQRMCWNVLLIIAKQYHHHHHHHKGWKII